MYTRKNFPIRGLLSFSGGHLIWLTAWGIIVTVLYETTHWQWLAIPWLPLSLIGTAVAFYVGFKNNSAYDRMWEARKIWGAIVNSSREWASTCRGFVSNQFNSSLSEEVVQQLQRKLIERHIAWLYTLRSQLLIPTQWEHQNASYIVRKVTKRRLKHFGVGLFEDESTVEMIEKYLPNEDMGLIDAKNTATQIIDRQSEHLKELRKGGAIDDFRHMELQRILGDFYVHQGKCERIKKFPLPRQYGSGSFIFVSLFIFLLPFGLVTEFHELGESMVWLTIPFTVIVGWVFVMMELIGDYSENPFEGLGNDIPMLSLCRTIEIDLLQMMGDEQLPDPIEVKNNVLM